MKNLFDYLQVCLEKVVMDNELGALTEALKGSYVEPGPGGDPIRNPLVLPTGKNIHALDPQSIPTAAAVKSARLVVERYVSNASKLLSPKLCCQDSNSRIPICIMILSSQ